MLTGKLIFVLCLAVLAVGIWTWFQYFDVYHLATVQPGVLYRDGMRSARQFAAAVRRVHPRTIVCLADDREIACEPFVGELAFCRENHIDVIRIPVRLGGWPNGEQVREFLAIATDPARRPVLVHCAQGVRRTGMMAAAYQETVLKFDRPQAKAAMLTFGHSQRTIGDVQRFIDLYDPQRQTMTEELPLSRE
jgi:protein tyrosine/serine phosphatase